jgi:hypothetical protein
MRDKSALFQLFVVTVWNFEPGRHGARNGYYVNRRNATAAAMVQW